jgi:MoaA/NifB/PqqE/SkfB family radical SAM enzyme
MSYRALTARTWRENIPFSALIELTYRCNLDCFFCYNDPGLQGVPLSTDHYFRLFEGLRDLGTMNLTLSGGEPLAHRDFFALGRKARALGFAVRIKSNGHALGGDRARRVRDEIDPFVIEVSLHGARPETHDRQTRVAGSFERLMSNLDEMRALGLRLKINSTLTRWNEAEVGAMLDLADTLGIPIQFGPEVSPRDNGAEDTLVIAPSREGVKRLLALLRARSQQPAQPMDLDQQVAPGPRVDPGRHCGAGSGSVTVDPFGNVFPCVQWRRAAGNLRHQSIADIWTGSPELARVRDLTAGAVREFVQGLGPQGSAVGFCPALAEQRTGSPVRLAADIRQRLDVLRELDNGDSDIG